MARKGIASRADVLTLNDGTDLNQIWDEFAQTLEEANAHRGALIDLLTFRTSSRTDAVLQSPTGTAEFEDASPSMAFRPSPRAEAAVLKLGYDFRWKDFATRYTWQYLADASAAQVESLHNGALSADSRLQYKTVLNALFNNATRTHVEQDGSTTEVYPLWNADGMAIPDYNGNTFDPNAHSHYMTTGTTTLTDPADVEDLIQQVTHHGYGEEDGAKIVVLCNQQEADVVAGWRAGDANGAKFDFISSDTSVPYLTTEQLVGQPSAGQLPGPEDLRPVRPGTHRSDSRWCPPGTWLPSRWVAPPR